MSTLVWGFKSIWVSLLHTRKLWPNVKVCSKSIEQNS